MDEALQEAAAAPTGPTFLDFPLDHVFMEAEVDADAPGELPDPAAAPAADAGAIERAAELLRSAERPVIMAGTGLYWARGEEALRALATELRIPVFLNGLGRGCVPADDPQFFSRARGTGLKGADVAIVVGVPMDFRLGFGGSFGDDTQIVVVGSAPPERPHPRAVAAELFGGVPATLDALREGASGGPDRTAWNAQLRELEDERRAGEQEELNDDRSPLHPLRLYKELGQVLDRDAVVIGDGGDFVSFAGRVIDTYEPGCWMDPGPYGCLGTGPGYALAAKLANPDRQVCLLLGDGAFGFAGHGVRHAGAPRRAGGRGHGQQRHLGAREAPDGVPLRVLRGRRPAAGLPLRRGRVRARRARRARRAAGRAAARAGAGLRLGQAGARERPHGPERRLPAQVEPGLAPRLRAQPRSGIALPQIKREPPGIIPGGS